MTLSKTAVVAAIAGAASISHAGVITEVVTFDDLALGPSTYAAAGPAQTLNYSSNRIAFNGGVVLGFPTAFPAVEFATEPNVYATASTITGADASLSDTMTIDIQNLSVTKIEGLLFNGEIIENDFEVRAYDAMDNLVDSAQYTIASNSDSGSAVFSLESTMGDIARVEFNEFNTDGEWNYLVDTIVFNRDIPAPGTMLPLAAIGLLGSRRRRA